MQRRSHAEDTQRVIDEEVSALLRRAAQRATTLLSDHRAGLDRIGVSAVSSQNGRRAQNN